MTVVSVPYRFRQRLRAPASPAYRWCTDFGPSDGALFSETTRRSIRQLGVDALVMTDTTFPERRPLRIRRLVRLYPAKQAWTSTHLDGPYRHSQFWYQIVPESSLRSHLDFFGLRLDRTERSLSPSEISRRAERYRLEDSGEWRRNLAPALARELAPHRA